MTRTANPRRGSAPSRARRRKAAKSSWLRVGLGLAALVALSVVVYVGRDLVESPPPPDLGRVAPNDSAGPRDYGDWDAGVAGALPRENEGLTTDPTVTTSIQPPPTSEAAATGDALPVQRSSPPGYATPGSPARLAIVIDDLGRSLEEVEILASIGVPLTYSVLPFETRTAAVVARLVNAGAEIMCHLPMEPSSGLDPGPGALRAGMSVAELVQATQRALAAVPGATGVNNHMGSGLSTHRPAMAAVLGVVADRGLYYLDSRTTPATVGYTVARELGIAAAERQVFLDADRHPDAIRKQLARLLDVARSRGGAIAIGHPYPETLAILREELPTLRERGFEFVTASALLDGA